MFTIIGGDGKEYGPVPAEQIRTWLTSGRANFETQAKKEGDDHWKRLGDFLEFAPGAEDAREQQPPPLAKGPIDPKGFAADLIARAAPLDLADCLERSWQLLKRNFWALVGTTFVIMVLSIVSGITLRKAMPMVGIPVSTLLGGLFNGGLYAYYLKKVRGQPTDLADAFSGFTLACVPLMLAAVVMALLTCLGLMLLILPGIYLVVAYSFTYLLIMDRKMGFWSAMEVSRRVISSQWWRLFGLLILGAILALLGVVGLFIGFFVTLPILIGAVVYAYEDLCNPPEK